MFSRNTIVKLVDALNFQTHSEVEKFALQFGLEDVIKGSYIKEKEASLMRFFIKDPRATAPDGAPLVQVVIEHLVSKFGASSEPSELFPELVNSLDRDGYALDKNGLRVNLPTQVPIIAEENELIELLNRFGYSVAKGHYEQAVSAHSRGDWAAANSQLRNFVEEFFDRAKRGQIFS